MTKVSLELNVVDLFSGCGGFSYGFEQAGFDVILGVDHWGIALETFKLNHRNSDVMNVDLHEDQAIKDIVSKIGGRRVDVIIGGPPCQGFSLTGTRDENDKRNRLFYSVFELARILNPRAIVIENVPGIANLYKGKAKDEIYRLSGELGYSCVHKQLYAPDFGVPQIRKRVFFVALKNDLGVFEFPKPSLMPDNYVGCEAAIGDLPPLVDDMGAEKLNYEVDPKSDYQHSMRMGCDYIMNHVSSKHTELVKKVISMVPEGGNHKDLPEGVGDSRKFNEAWTRYHSKKPSKTIDTGHRNHFHYKYNRIPTVRENARLQSFPDRFQFLGSKTEQYRQVGNAVPPLLGRVIAEQLVDYLL